MKRLSVSVASALLLAACFAGAADKARYEVRDGSVIYKSPSGPRPVANADVSTFQSLPGAFARDRMKVFFGDKIVEGADPNSFVVIDFLTGRDSKAIYRTTDRCDECDLETFRALGDGHWYVDKNAAYSALNDSWRRISDVDPGAFAVLNKWFAKDRRSVFLNNERVPGADAETFKLAACGACEVCGEDKNRCYWFEHAVPCNCKPHGGGGFPSGLTEAAEGKAVLATTAPVSFGDSVRGKMSAGLLVVEPGARAVELTCWDSATKSSLPAIVSVNLQANRFYRFTRKKNTKCEISIDRPTLVQGWNARQTLYIRSNKPRMQVEIAAGVQKLQIVCREVTRAAILEIARDIDVDLRPGELYRLEGQVAPTKGTCDVHARSLAVE